MFLNHNLKLVLLENTRILYYKTEIFVQVRSSISQQNSKETRLRERLGLGTADARNRWKAQIKLSG